jgi:single-stranded DNA-binding protein
MLNRIILIGRLTRDPEMKYLANGGSTPNNETNSDHARSVTP